MYMYMSFSLCMYSILSCLSSYLFFSLPFQSPPSLPSLPSFPLSDYSRSSKDKCMFMLYLRAISVVTTKPSSNGGTTGTEFTIKVTHLLYNNDMSSGTSLLWTSLGQVEVS